MFTIFQHLQNSNYSTSKYVLLTAINLAGFIFRNFLEKFQFSKLSNFYFYKLILKILISCITPFWGYFSWSWHKSELATKRLQWKHHLGLNYVQLSHTPCLIWWFNTVNMELWTQKVKHQTLPVLDHLINWSDIIPLNYLRDFTISKTKYRWIPENILH